MGKECVIDKAKQWSEHIIVSDEIKLLKKAHNHFTTEDFCPERLIRTILETLTFIKLMI